MGKVWIEMGNGRIIHLPIIGEADANTPGAPFYVGRFFTHENPPPTNFDKNVEIKIRETGEVFTIEFAPNGRAGKCNRCGVCCTHAEDKCPDSAGQCGYVHAPLLGVHKCKYLHINGKNGLGKPGGASCLAWGGILETFKGCALWPDKPGDIDARILRFCAFSFGI